MNNKEDISLHEYTSKLLKKGLREDGRKLYNYRKLEIKTGTLSQANGSARVKLGDTEVFVGVKLSVGEPFPDSPDEGILIVSTELSPLSSKDFETGPPSPRSIEMARVIDRAIRESKTIDTPKLCIKAKEKVWIVFIDVYPVNADGNLLDASLIGALAALKTAKMPKYNASEGLVDHKELTSKKLPLTDEPTLCTFSKLNGSIFVDSTDREEKVADCRLSIGINKKNDICAMQKGGEGTFTEAEIIELISKAQELSKPLRKQLTF